MKRILLSSFNLVVLLFVSAACGFTPKLQPAETPTSTSESWTASPAMTSLSTSVPVSTPSLILAPTPTPAGTGSQIEYRNDYFSLSYDNILWEEGFWQLSGPPLRLPALLHRSLKGCRIGFRQGGWSGNHEIQKVETNVQLGAIGFHVVKVIIPEDNSVEGISYTAYDIQTGKAYSLGGMDFWLGKDNLEPACIQDVEQVLVTLRPFSASNP